MKAQRGCVLVPWLVAAIGFLVLTAAVVGASEDPGKREIAISLTAGQSYVIKDLKANSTPGVHVLENPNALIVNSDTAGQLVLVGTQAGEWAIDAELASGEQVTYKVVVHGVANPKSPLIPGTTPPPMGEPSFSGRSTSGAPLDAGSGPVEASKSKPAEVASASPAGSGGAGAATSGASAVPPATGATAKAADSPAPSSKAADPVTVAEAAPGAAASASGGSASPAPVPSAGTGTSTPASPPAAASVAAAPVPSAGDPNGASSVMTSQGASEIPVQKFSSDPMANLSTPPPGAVGGAKHYLPDDVVMVVSGQSKIFDFTQRVRRVSVADTEVADIQVINPFQLNLIGHKAGFTTLAVWDLQGRYIEREVRVDPVGKQQVMLNVIVAELDRNRIENQGINYTVALPNYNLSMVSMAGNVATPYSSGTNLFDQVTAGVGAVALAPPAGVLPAGGSIIPLLLSPQVTYGLAAQNSNVLTQSLFQFLEDHNFGKILAEPHLLANSGEKAEFLSGGEIPIVVAQALNTSIVFKQFGTSVSFLPTVVGQDDIELEVKPEVSAPDYGKGVNLFGFTVPAFDTRRAQTFVRLRNNQTLIIAGLILHTKTSELKKVPYLGDIPIAGALFHSTAYNEQDTDLVMSVTPQIVQPLPANGQVLLPTDRPPLNKDDTRTERLSAPDVSRPRF